MAIWPSTAAMEDYDIPGVDGPDLPHFVGPWLGSASSRRSCSIAGMTHSPISLPIFMDTASLSFYAEGAETRRSMMATRRIIGPTCQEPRAPRTKSRVRRSRRPHGKGWSPVRPQRRTGRQQRGFRTIVRVGVR